VTLMRGTYVCSQRDIARNEYPIVMCDQTTAIVRRDLRVQIRGIDFIVVGHNKKPCNHILTIPHNTTYYIADPLADPLGLARTMPASGKFKPRPGSQIQLPARTKIAMRCNCGHCTGLAGVCECMHCVESARSGVSMVLDAPTMCVLVG
jgi:hypothetical protein